MRILHLAPRLSKRGGADQHLSSLLSALAAGHENHLAVGQDDGAARAPCPLTMIPGLQVSGLRPAPDPRDALDRLCDKIEPDVVHVHNVVEPRALEWAASTDALLTIQDHRFFCPGRGKWNSAGQVCRTPFGDQVCEPCFSDRDYFREVLALTRRRIEATARMRVCVLSRYMKRELVEVGLESVRISVIGPFVHGLEPDGPADGPPCALFVGRLVLAKGVRDAIEAFRMSGIGLPLVLAGTGSLRPELEAAGLAVRGWLDREQLARLFRRAQVLIMPSRWQEPFGIAGLEALHMGVPVAAWHSGGVAEWHPGPGLSAWGDTDQLAAGVRGLAGKRASAPAGFGRQRQMESLLGIYREKAGK